MFFRTAALRTHALGRRPRAGLHAPHHHHHGPPPTRRSNRYGAKLAVLGAAGLAAYFWVDLTSTDIVPISHRKRHILLDKSIVDAIEESGAESVPAGVPVLPSSHRYTVAVKKVGLRIAAAVEAFEAEHIAYLKSVLADRRARIEGWTFVPAAVRDYLVAQLTHPDAPLVRGCKPKRWDWNFVVVDDPLTCNAFCAPGGTIVVYTGILYHIDESVALGKVKDRETALATLMSHEVAHALARHGIEGVPMVVADHLLSKLEDSDDSTLLSKSFRLLLDRPRSRAFETEADHIGMHLLAKARYDVRKAPEFYLSLQSNSGITAWVSTHPADAARYEFTSDIACKIWDAQEEAYARKMQEHPWLAALSFAPLPALVRSNHGHDIASPDRSVEAALTVPRLPSGEPSPAAVQEFEASVKAVHPQMMQ